MRESSGRGYSAIPRPKVSPGPHPDLSPCMLIFLSYNTVDLSSIARTSVAASNSPLASYSPAIKKEGSVGMSEEDEVRHTIHCPSPRSRVS